MESYRERFERQRKAAERIQSFAMGAIAFVVLMQIAMWGGAAYLLYALANWLLKQ